MLPVNKSASAAFVSQHFCGTQVGEYILAIFGLSLRPSFDAAIRPRTALDTLIARAGPLARLAGHRRRLPGSSSSTDSLDIRHQYFSLSFVSLFGYVDVTPAATSFLLELVVALCYSHASLHMFHTHMSHIGPRLLFSLFRFSYCI